MRVDDFLSRLEKVKGRNGRWIACCPAHDDRSPSLTIAEGDDGRILLHCFGGCDPSNVVGAVGLSLSDLMPERVGTADYLPRMRFNSLQVLEALSFHATVVAVAAATMGEGGRLTAEERDRLMATAGEIYEALKAVKGTMQ